MLKYHYNFTDVIAIADTGCNENRVHAVSLQQTCNNNIVIPVTKYMFGFFYPSYTHRKITEGIAVLLHLYESSNCTKSCSVLVRVQHNASFVDYIIHAAQAR